MSVHSLTRPVFKSALARSLYERLQTEDQLRSLDKSQWYHCNLEQTSSDVSQLFYQSCFDQEAQVFLENCYAKSDWLLTQLFHALVKVVLGWFMTQTSVNGLLGRGSMFVFSSNQFEQLLEWGPYCRETTLLDLGAGDGAVTQVMASHFHTVHVTEISPVMRKILHKRGFTVLDAYSWSNGTVLYDVISCLNLLDRCDQPISLLAQIRSKLKPISGRLIVALVLPISQYVETGSSHQPTETLSLEGDTVEAQVTSLYQKVFQPSGFQLLRWTRLPYLCEGDVDQSFYWLDDYVFVLKPL